MTGDARTRESTGLPQLVEQALEGTRHSVETLEQVRQVHAGQPLERLAERFLEIERQAESELGGLLAQLRLERTRELVLPKGLGLPVFGREGAVDARESAHAAGALLVALKRHARAAALFTGLASWQSDPSVRELLETLATAERRRSEQLRAAYRCVARVAGGVPTR